MSKRWETLREKLSKIDKGITFLGIAFSLFMLATAVYTGIKVQEQINTSAGIVVMINMSIIAVLFGFFTWIYAEVKTGLQNMDDRIGLHANHDEGIGQSLAEIIKYLSLAKPKKRKEVRKRFKGICHYLEKRGLARNLDEDILDEIKKNPDCSAVTTYPLDWWFQPEGLFYLAKQLLEVSKKNGKIERFAIYDHNVFKDEYGDEILDLCEVHRLAGGQLKMMFSNQLDDSIDEMIKNMKLDRANNKRLKEFVKNYRKKTKWLPDGIIINNNVAYLRNPESGEMELYNEPKTFQLYIDFLNESYKRFKYDEKALDKDIRRS